MWDKNILSEWAYLTLIEALIENCLQHQYKPTNEDPMF